MHATFDKQHIWADDKNRGVFHWTPYKHYRRAFFLQGGASLNRHISIVGWSDGGRSRAGPRVITPGHTARWRPWSRGGRARSRAGPRRRRTRWRDRVVRRPWAGLMSASSYHTVSSGCRHCCAGGLIELMQPLWPGTNRPNIAGMAQYRRWQVTARTAGPVGFGNGRKWGLAHEPLQTRSLHIFLENL